MNETRQEWRLRERQGRKAPAALPSGVAAARPQVGWKWSMIALAVGALVAGIGLAVVRSRQAMKGKDLETVTASLAGLPSMEALMKMSEEELARTGIAAMNLACAADLPGRSQQSSEDCLRRLHQIAEAVRVATARNLHRFAENPAEYENSEAFYKVGMMVTVLDQDLGVRYNPKKIQPATIETVHDLSFFDNPEDVFLTGLLGQARMGTCSSMPVLCVALGRKLGYPLKLVGAKGHLFFRWEDGQERRNFECTNGVACPPDSHFQQWPFPISEAEKQQGWYLRSLGPKEELAVLLKIRASVLNYHGQPEQALVALSRANELWPNHPDIAAAMQLAMRRTMPPGRSPFDIMSTSPAEAEIEAAMRRATHFRGPGSPQVPLPRVPIPRSSVPVPSFR